MVCCGVLPIDQLRDYWSPINLVCTWVPKYAMEHTYKIKLPDTYNGSQFLQIYAGLKGYMTGWGIPDEAKAAKIILKDFCNGKLLFNCLWPDYD